MTDIQTLKDSLPHLMDIVADLTHHSGDEYQSPNCPFCGQGDDRFIVNVDTNRFWCRSCKTKADVIDYLKQTQGTDFKGVCRMYSKDAVGHGKSAKKLPAVNTKNQKYNKQEMKQKLSTEAIQERWKFLYFWNPEDPWQIYRNRILIFGPTANPPWGIAEQHKRNLLFAYLADQRKIPANILDKAIEKKIISQAEKDVFDENFDQIGTEPVACFLYKDKSGNPITVQLVSLSGNPLKPSGTKKMFEFNHDAENGFLYAGADLEAAKTVVLVEAAINALSVESIVPDVAIIAVGTADGEKVKKLKRRLAKKKIICFFDNDGDGEDATQDVKAALPDANVLTVHWTPNDPKKFDANDLLQTDQNDRIREMIENATTVESIPSEKPYNKSADDPHRFFIGDKFAPVLLCDEFLANRDCFYDGLSFYIYNKERGVWEKKHQNEISKIVKNYLSIQANSMRISDSLRILEIECFKNAKELQPQKGLLNFRNGMLDVATMTLKPHDKRYYSTIQINIEYDPNAKCPAWDKYINSILPGEKDKQRTIKEFAGYIFNPSNFLEKFLFFLGSGSNGKSIFVAIISKILSVDYVCNIEPHQIEDRFTKITLRDKLLNAVADINAKKKISESDLKKITSIDVIRAEVKFKSDVHFRSN